MESINRERTIQEENYIEREKKIYIEKRLYIKKNSEKRGNKYRKEIHKEKRQTRRRDNMKIIQRKKRKHT